MWLLTPLTEIHQEHGWMFLQLSRERLNDLLDHLDLVRQWQEANPRLDNAVFEMLDLDMLVIGSNLRINALYRNYCRDMDEMVPLPEALDPRTIIISSGGTTVVDHLVPETAIEECRMHVRPDWLHWEIILSNDDGLLETTPLSRAQLASWASSAQTPVPVLLAPEGDSWAPSTSVTGDGTGRRLREFDLNRVFAGIDRIRSGQPDLANSSPERGSNFHEAAAARVFADTERGPDPDLMAAVVGQFPNAVPNPNDSDGLHPLVIPIADGVSMAPDMRRQPQAATGPGIAERVEAMIAAITEANRTIETVIVDSLGNIPEAPGGDAAPAPQDLGPALFRHYWGQDQRPPEDTPGSD